MKPDFQIVGAGLIGLSTAYALIKRGATVRIIEAENGVALGTSFANAGMAHASLANPWNNPGVWKPMLRSLFDPSSPMKLRWHTLPGLAPWGLQFLRHSAPRHYLAATRSNYDLAAQSMKLIRQWQQELEIDMDFRRTGLIKLFRRETEYKNAKTLTDMLAGQGLSATYLDAGAVVEKEPALKPVETLIKGAVYYPDDFAADAYKFCKALESTILAKGGTILTQAHVTGFLRDGQTIRGVETGRDTLEAMMTIIAAGARSKEMLARCGIRIPVRPVKGYSLTFDNITGPKFPVADETLHAAVTPLGNRLRIAGTAEFTGLDQRLPSERLAPLLDFLKSVYPDLSEGLTNEDGKPWCGFRPVSANGRPIIRNGPLPGLAINTGHGHMGWTYSAGSGELMADILMDRKS